MNLIDVLLLLIVAFAMWAGWAKGFILGMKDLFVWIGSLLTGFLFYKDAGALLQKAFSTLGVWTLPFAFILIVLLSRILLGYLLHLLLKNTPRTTHQSNTNRAFGLLPGLVTGCVYAVVAAALLVSIPFWNGLAKQARESRIAARLANEVAWLDEKFSPVFNQAASDVVNRMTAKPEEGETVELHYTVNDPEERPDLEAQMLVLVNEERTKRGLQPVKADPELARVARAHSTDMFARGYFSHYNRQQKDPFQRMDAAGVKFTSAGENLALGRTLTICHEGLMNSPGHKANILNPSFGRLGIGIMDGGIYGLMISQEFRN